MEDKALRLIKTKLYRPLLGGETIRRQRLIDLLDSGGDLPLTLVTAPAGSGKTTLLCDWLSTCPCPNAWLSLDDDDGDIAVFLSYFIAAIQTVFPDACPTVRAMLRAPEVPPQHVLAAALINEIDALRSEPALAAGRRFVLVLDDYHLLHSRPVDDLLTALLRHPSPALRLVLTSRSDPALPLPAMRARRQLLEVRFQQLRFSEQETVEFLQQTLDVPLPGETTAALVQRTEGWITGLHLASIYLRHAPNPADRLRAIQAGDRYVMDYLMDEVLALLPAKIQEFLLKTSILDRLCGPLVEAVACIDDEVCNGRAYLEWLEQANLFVFVLDDQWYRYHHLLQQLMLNRLRQQVSAAEIATLHGRASAWFARNGLVEEAISHALAAGDDRAAVQIVEAHRHQAMNQEHWQQIERWLGLMPHPLIAESPELLLMEAWILQKQWRLAEIGPLLDRIDARLKALPPSEAGPSYLSAEVDALRSLVRYYRLDGEATFALASRALEALPMACSSVRGLGWMYYAAGLQVRGDISGALEAIHLGLAEDRFHRNAFPARVMMAHCFLHWINADPANLRQAADHFLRVAQERALLESVWWARYFHGCAAYAINDLATAEREFAAVVEQRYVAHGMPFTQGAYGLASVWQAQGAGERALALVESVLAYGQEIDNARIQMDAQAFLAWLALCQGRSDEAYRWAESVDPRVLTVPMTTFHIASLSQVKILIAAHTSASLNRAASLLARLEQQAQGNVRATAEVLAVRALLDDALADEEAALSALQEAVALAQPGGLLRVFVDLGAPMARLLNRLALQDRAGAARILRAFPPAPATSAHRPHVSPPQPALIEPLTYREIEVLELLAQRLSAKEIAERLVISDRTVKRHAANIYQKLGVNGRQQAVAAATALGVLRVTP